MKIEKLGLGKEYSPRPGVEKECLAVIVTGLEWWEDCIPIEGRQPRNYASNPSRRIGMG